MTSKEINRSPSGATSTAPMAILYSRFSSDKQADGASLARQTEAAKRYCEANGLILNDERFHDAGVSAFHGKNKEEGELKRFLDLVGEGVIPQGSVLIIESNDRLSRMNHRKGARLFEDIIDAGVDIVTLSDGRRYTQEELERDPLVLVMIIMLASRAHEESKMKSIRLKDVWGRNAKATAAGERIRTKIGPHWLTLNGDLKGGEWIIDEEKAGIVREVFARYAAGEGSSTIARNLRKRGLSSPRGGHWRGSSIIQLLRRESPFGRLEIGKGQGNTREVIDVVESYFPRIIDEATEARVKARLAGEKPVKLGGRNSDEPMEEEKPKRTTQGAWTGRLFREDGQRLKVKKYARTAAYVGQVDGKYCKAVSVLDGILLHGWGQIRAAWESAVDKVQGDAEEFGDEVLRDAQEAVLEAERRWEKRPSAANLAALEATRQERDDIRRNLKEQARRERTLAAALPGDIGGLEAHEVNRWVRLVVERAEVGREFAEGDPEGRGVLRIAVRLKNGAGVVLWE